MYGGKPMSKGGNGRKGSIGLKCGPGDRGDSSNGISAMGGKSPDMPSQLKSECSEGYESVNGDWHGNVKR